VGRTGAPVRNTSVVADHKTFFIVTRDGFRLSALAISSPLLPGAHEVIGKYQISMIFLDL
jgi:hypothetical protein